MRARQPRKRDTMRSIGIAATFSLLLALPLGCSRNNIEAVNLANDGDKAKGSNLDDAISKYEQATQLDPTNHRILWKLALAYHKKEDWAKDATASAQAEKLAPTFANYYFEQGYALEQQAVKGPTSWTEAEGPLKESVAKDPNMAQGYEELAEVDLRLDREQDALQNYSKAIETKPDEIQYYPPLADLYKRLGYMDLADKVLHDALSVAKEGEKHLFEVHLGLGAIAEAKGNSASAIPEYEAAKKVCGACNEGGKQIVFFALGGAYADANPPRKSEAIQQLQAFSKIVCRGAAAQRYADQCSVAQDIVKRLGGTLQ
jgi:tetratricopeptide (TPR) repeat protein